MPRPNPLKKSLRKLAGTLDSLRIIGPDTIYDDQYYEKMNQEDWVRDSDRLAEALIAEFDPGSVLSLGCGTGRNLSSLYERGVSVHGVDGSVKAIDYGMIPDDHLELHDLRDPYSPPSEFDLSLCVEVLEHIPAKFADVLVESIVSSGEWIVVTAAEPGQGGTHHINEQSRSYWQTKFRERNATYRPSKTESLRTRLDDIEELVWIPENLMIFES